MMFIQVVENVELRAHAPDEFRLAQALALELAFEHLLQEHLLLGGHGIGTNVGTAHKERLPEDGDCPQGLA